MSAGAVIYQVRKRDKHTGEVVVISQHAAPGQARRAIREFLGVRALRPPVYYVPLDPITQRVDRLTAGALKAWHSPGKIEGAWVVEIEL